MIITLTSSFTSIKDNNPISSNLTYYGILKNVIELDYTVERSVILFEIDWISKGKRLKEDEDGFILTNFNKIKWHQEPFALASQVQQVFYVENHIHPT
ncbi:hypothetical protein MA16_Dca004651 [Dendrobium catenatum]|uniref:DUF4216 domain-containing protein n=1 Tax=Dendrobium catenatum TaxID=906689 RepID=A0A2I0VNQ0_9ASPA|nr:hypothetical protein MA16_Dca004651 [Dendrobium catenatum]